MRLIVLGYLVLFVFSCKDNNKAVREAMHSEVMEIHDAVMPRMSEIHDLKGKLRGALAPQKDSTQVFELLTQLSKADDVMMAWMADFKAPGDKVTEEEFTKFYTEEKVKITTVKSTMEEAINAANEFLKQDSLNKK